MARIVLPGEEWESGPELNPVSFDAIMSSDRRRLPALGADVMEPQGFVPGLPAMQSQVLGEIIQLQHNGNLIR